MRTMIGAVLASLLAIFPAHGQEPALFDAAGYRATRYRAPVHRPPDAVGRIAPGAVAGLRPDIDVILIDVLPAEGGHRESDGRWRLAREHRTIPGAHWFPESGRGSPPPDILPWFERGLARLTHGDRDRMIVTFCLSDCWMGWNAARRLRSLGYRNVWWLAEGSDGWRDLAIPLVPVLPERR